MYFFTELCYLSYLCIYYDCVKTEYHCEHFSCKEMWDGIMSLFEFMLKSVSYAREDNE